ncbi:ubiquinone/menaquinone biosynthesis methyltransferase [Desulfonatronovibrio hydrogenovorans]|uniref:ubiquinone/menaquinone biosynthesis methyltransferase n=1 Tax=Desulfonatronovibrio hydrogenovorans TaxID=53245 RepID=UPI00048F0570|nr:ubiquinone/menaquinone biosynthesis methyltransferase [Desulfonatronovibrio hydrogenovorans]
MNRTGHGRMVAGYFASIAGWYDFLNHFLSFGLDVYWRNRLVRHVRAPENGLVLDLAAGTMDVTSKILSKYPGVQVLAADFTLPMLTRGQKKVAFRAGDVIPVQADGRALPVPDRSIDTVTIAFGIRNIVPRPEAYQEILRVLKPGGRLCILEFGTGRKKIWQGLYNFYLNRVLPFIGRAISRDKGAYSYLADTIRHFPDSSRLALEMKQAGFSRVFYYPLSSGIVYIHVGEKGRD